MAQAYSQLGSKVTVLSLAKVLPRDDQDLVKILRKQFDKDNIALLEEVAIQSIAQPKRKY